MWRIERSLKESIPFAILTKWKKAQKRLVFVPFILNIDT